MEAPRERASRTTPASRSAPRRRLKRSVNAKVMAMTTAVKKTTPFSPKRRWMPPIATSYSHSHAYHVCPPMVTENGSVRAIECVRSISSPLRMCHPMLASPNRRGASAPPVMAASSTIKIRSLAEGTRNRNHAGGGAACGARVSGLRERVSICAGFQSKVCPHLTGTSYPMEQSNRLDAGDSLSHLENKPAQASRKAARKCSRRGKTTEPGKDERAVGILLPRLSRQHRFPFEFGGSR